MRHKVDARQQAAERPFTHEVLVRPTGFSPPGEPDAETRVEFQRLCDAVMNSESRNQMIITEIVATGRFLGEGFDDSRLDTLFLTMPVSWRGTIAQYVGRLHRLHDGKRVVQVYDYADLDVPMLCRMLDRRCAGYEAVGYALLLPASALPGWPAAVPLPIDSQWKTDHAASVRRLIRDGVDQPLATLFLQATRPAENNDRSELECDFLHPTARIVIEIDGPQHLTPEHYRRDRRKDMLLQTHGYVVLRFLAEDLSKHLGALLDTIDRAIAARKS